MSAVSSWKIWLVFAGVFLAGGIAGGFIALRVEERIVERGRSPEQFVPRLVRHLSSELDFTDEQREQLKVMANEAWQELHEQRQASRDTMQELQQQIGEILTDSQREQYRKMRESQRQRWQKLAGDRRSEGHVCGPDCEIHPRRGKGMPPRPEGAPPPPEGPPPPPE